MHGRTPKQIGLGQGSCTYVGTLLKVRNEMEDDFQEQGALHQHGRHLKKMSSQLVSLRLVRPLGAGAGSRKWVFRADETRGFVTSGCLT